MSDRNASTLWILLLTAASIVTTLALACVTPFTALATVAATRMRPRDGVALMLVAWGASQAVGFCLLAYPRDVTTLLWGVALGMAAVVAVVAARAALGRIAPASAVGQVIVAYLVAAAAFKLVILLWALGLGGVATTLSPANNARELVRDAAILAGLLLLHRGLAAAGLPDVRRQAVAAC